MNHIKRHVLILISCTIFLLLLAGCSGPSSSAQSQKNAVLTALNKARVSNGVSTLVENEQADIVASRMANCGIDYARGNLTEDQFKTEYYDAALTTIRGNYCTALYSSTYVPTRASDFYGEKVAYKNGSIVGIAIRQSGRLTTISIIVY